MTIESTGPNLLLAHTSSLSPATHFFVEYALARVRRVAAENDLHLPDLARQEILAVKATEAELAFFEASLHDPTATQIEEFFTFFVLAAIGESRPV